MAEPDAIQPETYDSAVLHALRTIPEVENRVLRVVFVDEGEERRVITAFFDRRRNR